jgi:hypothetical protein
MAIEQKYPQKKKAPPVIENFEFPETPEGKPKINIKTSKAGDINDST